MCVLLLGGGGGGGGVQGKHHLCFVEPSLLFPRCMRLGEHEILCVAV